MKRLPRLSVFVLSALGALAMLSGCGGDSEYEGQRLENLNAAVEEFDPGSISEVLCDADSWQAVADRFSDLGYSVTGVSPRLAASRSDGFLVAGRLIERPGSQPAVEEELSGRGCTIPAGGAVAIQFEERDAT